MKRKITLLVLAIAVVGLAACDVKLFKPRPKADLPEITPCDASKTDCPVVLTPDEDTIRPKPRAGTAFETGTAGPGFVEGVAAEKLDESTQQDKQDALEATDTASEKNLGKTIASLGDVGQQGFWLKTPLVLAEAEGRLVWADNGNSVNVTLLPKQGESTSGSQISLAAMRALGIPLTALPELIVFAK